MEGGRKESRKGIRLRGNERNGRLGMEEKTREIGCREEIKIGGCKNEVNKEDGAEGCKGMGGEAGGGGDRMLEGKGERALRWDGEGHERDKDGKERYGEEESEKYCEGRNVKRGRWRRGGKGGREGKGAWGERMGDERYAGEEGEGR